MEELRGRFHEYVKEKLVSDVPLVCLLSGGIDSNCGVAEAVRMHLWMGTYTIGFNDLGEEAHYAADLAERRGMDYNVHYFDEEGLAVPHHLSEWHDQP